MSKPRNPKEKPGKAGEVTFVCPSCLARYRYNQSELARRAKLCDYCRVALVREDDAPNTFRCLHCTRRIVTPEGVWCTHFDCAPTPEGALRCSEFKPRAAKRRARRSK